MKERIIWTVTTNTDLTEGRGTEYVKHFCRLESTAIRLARRGYVQDMDCPVSKVTIAEEDGKVTVPSWFIRVLEPTQDDERQEQHRLKVREVLDKAKASGLTDDEIALLARGQP